MASESFWVFCFCFVLFCFVSTVESLWAASQAIGHPETEEKQKPNHRIAASFPSFAEFKAHFQLSVLSESLLGGFVLAKKSIYAFKKRKKRKRKGLWRSNRCPLGLLPKCHQFHHSNKIPLEGGSPTFPKTRRWRLFQKVTREKSKLKLEL